MFICNFSMLCVAWGGCFCYFLFGFLNFQENIKSFGYFFIFFFENSLTFRSLNEMCFHFKKVTHASPLQHSTSQNAIKSVKPDGIAAKAAPVCAAAAAAFAAVLVVYVTEPVRGPPQNSVDYHGHSYRARDDGLQ